MAFLWTDTAITYLKGVGPQRAKAFASELSIRSYGDLLSHYPFRYVDRSVVLLPEACVASPAEVQVKGRITDIQATGAGARRRLTAQLVSDDGRIELIWFKGANYIQKTLKAGAIVIAYGRVTSFNGRLNMAHPDLEDVARFKDRPSAGLHPVYPSSEKLSRMGLHSKGIANLVQTLLGSESLTDWLPQALVEKKGWPDRMQAIQCMHQPTSQQALIHARERLAFEEVLLDQLIFAVKRQAIRAKGNGWVFRDVGSYFNQFFHEILPFELTGAQKRVVKEIRMDMASGMHMNRLVQGDVGSGKTLVAFMALLLAIDNGFQGCLMAPTEILAQQHHQGLSQWANQMGLNVALLTGSIKGAQRKKILEGILGGRIHLLVGTHALIEKPVKFRQLGLAIIDEQHRFGVAQRAALREKNTPSPHILVMTATPIPRTLAMSLYGDLDLSVIDELPPGRKPIETLRRTDSGRLKVWGFLKKAIAQGRQAYIVYPLIEESDSLDYKDLMDGYASICRDFPRPDYQISIVHGRMKSTDKSLEMDRFVKGETHIMVATTVIEVGVDVPNASVMVIENAEKFGLSQLHQLRGRVGRGSAQSYCILMTGKALSDHAKVRIETMCSSHDGFVIADVDLKLRGPGEVMGTRQSGSLDYRLAKVGEDQPLFTWARQVARDIMDQDPRLEAAEHAGLRQVFTAYAKGRIGWGDIA